MRLLSSMSIVALVIGACATPDRPAIRALPTTLSTDAARLLAGCEVQASSWDFEARCDDLVVARHAQPGALEPPWLGLAADRGNHLGAKVSWSDRALFTDDGSRPLREARFLGIAGDEDLGFLLGLSRAPDGDVRDDLWCTGERTSGDGVVRCEAILTALLQPATASATSLATTETTPPTSTTAAVPARLRGRALSLPTSCLVKGQDGDHGTYRCPEVTLAWRVATDMDAAAGEADAILASLASDEVAVPLPCRLGYEASVCRGTQKVVVGTAYVDGDAVIASCVAVDDGDGDEDARGTSACRILLNGGW